MAQFLTLVTLTGSIMFTPLSDDLLVASYLLNDFLARDRLLFSWFTLWISCLVAFTWFYLIGYTIRRFIPEKRVSKVFERAKTMIERRGPRIVLISYFLPGVRHPIHYVSGFIRIPITKYMTYNLCGSALYSLVWTLIIRFFSDTVTAHLMI